VLIFVFLVYLSHSTANNCPALAGLALTSPQDEPAAVVSSIHRFRLRNRFWKGKIRAIFRARARARKWRGSTKGAGLRPPNQTRALSRSGSTIARTALMWLRKFEQVFGLVFDLLFDFVEDLSFIVPQARDDGGSEARSTTGAQAKAEARARWLRLGTMAFEILLAKRFERPLFSTRAYDTNQPAFPFHHRSSPSNHL
jgi:hypothetical protein